jgi:hypothetical protein
MVIVQVPVFRLPDASVPLEVAVIVTLPVAPERIVTLPLVSTVALVLSLEVHSTPGVVALLGSTVAVRFVEPPGAKVAVDGLTVTFVTGTVVSLALTVTVHVPVYVAASLPVRVKVAVIVAVPTALAVTTPLLTVATVSAEDDH